MSERWRGRDVQIHVMASGAGALLGALVGAAIGSIWWSIGMMAGFLLGNAAVKLLHPSNSVSKNESWIAFLTPAFIVLAALFLLQQPHLLGGWTIIVVFGAFFVYGLISLISSARGHNRTNDQGASDDGAD